MIVDEKSGEVNKPAKQYHDALQTTLTFWVLDAMTDKIKTFWIPAAAKTINTWTMKYKNARTMTAFLKRHGVYKPSKKTVVVDWNRELLSPTFEDIRAFINTWKTQLATARLYMKQDFDLVLVRIQDELRMNASFGGKTMQTFWDQFLLHRINADKSCDSLFDSIFADVEECLKDLSGDGTKYQFHTAMNKLYDNCLNPGIISKGPKVTSRRWDYLKSGIMSQP